VDWNTFDHQKNLHGKSFLDKRSIPTIWEKVSTNEVKWLQISKTDRWKASIYDINLRSRIANKVYLLIWQSNTQTFDQLFDFVYSLDLSIYIQAWQKISISAHSHNSMLTSIPSIQSITQKAIIKKLLSFWANAKNPDNHKISSSTDPSLDLPAGSQVSGWKDNSELLQIDANKADFEIFIFLQDNLCKVFLNTSWISLHNRWYRQQALEAPIKENVAAWLILLSWRKFLQAFYDPFCWSWTICIEAAMIAKNMPVGINRSFAFQDFPDYDSSLFQTIKEKALSKVFTDKKYKIFGSDIDPLTSKIATQNAINAWVDDTIIFEKKDFLSISDMSWYMVSNPPYGKRLQDFDLTSIYSHIDKLFSNPDLSWWIITSYEWFKDIIDKTKYSSKTIFNWADKCSFWKKA